MSNPANNSTSIPPVTSPPPSPSNPSESNTFNPFAPPPPGNPQTSPTSSTTQAPFVSNQQQNRISNFNRSNPENPTVPGENVRQTPTPTSQCSINGSPCQQSLDSGINQARQEIQRQNLNFEEIARLLNTGGQAVDLALLNRIDTKLGAQIPGGIGGKLTGLSRRMKLPEIFNVLAFLATLHNAAMLSKNLAVTMGDIATLGLNNESI